VKILINNLFDGVLQRGIVNYTRNLNFCLIKMGHNIKIVDSKFIPFSTNMPRIIFNVTFVLYEQFILPLIGIFYAKIIYPYNSSSMILSIFSSKQILVIHDFIPYSKKYSPSLLYLRCTVFIHSFFKRDVAFITPKIEQEAIQRGLFLNSKRYVIPNCFFEIENLLKQKKDSKFNFEYVLLCSGLSENKDLKGALNLLKLISNEVRVIILGAPNFKIEENLNHSLVILDQLLIEEVASYYRNAKFVWVHSQSEGFGRSIVEARLAGKAVLASAIPEFLEQSSENVYFYHDSSEFVEAWEMADKPVQENNYTCEYNENAKLSLERWCS
jgi:hypothetical protein